MYDGTFREEITVTIKGSGHSGQDLSAERKLHNMYYTLSLTVLQSTMPNGEKKKNRSNYHKQAEAGQWAGREGNWGHWQREMDTGVGTLHMMTFINHE